MDSLKLPGSVKTAAIMTIAASAVYAYAKNNSAPENGTVPETETEPEKA